MATTTTHILVLGATGRVGHHVVDELVARLSSGGYPPVVIHAATRDPSSAAAQRLVALASTAGPVRVELLPLDLAAASEEALEGACRDKALIFLGMPQSFTPQQMLECQQRLAAVLARTKPRGLVKLSSYGIDELSSKFVTTQGPLGEAHREGESALQAANIPWLVSLRPSSFFANFDAYDLPGLLQGGRCIRSPLGSDARVNWISCEDIGAAGAALLVQALSPSSPEKAGFQAIDVLGPQANTLSGPDFAALVSRARALPPPSTVTYEETPLPPDPAYGGLWAFLRAGGFDASLGDEEPLWRDVVGWPARRLEAHVTAALVEGVEKGSE